MTYDEILIERAVLIDNVSDYEMDAALKRLNRKKIEAQSLLASQLKTDKLKEAEAFLAGFDANVSEVKADTLATRTGHFLDLNEKKAWGALAEMKAPLPHFPNQ